MRCSLNELFSIIGSNAGAGNFGAEYVRQEELFGLTEEPKPIVRQYNSGDIDFTLHYFTRGFCVKKLEGIARVLFELSRDAFDTALHAWMSEEPVVTEIIRYCRKVIAAAQVSGCAAEKAACDRGDSDTLAVLSSAGRVFHEVHRMMGLMRFIPGSNGIYTARCAPDHFILPVLGEHFTSRFGETAWAVTDEKRNLILCRNPGEQIKIFPCNDKKTENSAENSIPDEWETLWKHYHRTINNESRNNAGLQRQLMPKRYWKYLSEMEND
ncbi:MAG: TIGR03915 family putative DNA repair protein [Treponema sp.]|nr:TIGR03915 family putative DNA repair protein [Treponema sp.]